MREKNISMLLKLSLIVLFASSIVQQNFASNEGDDQSPSRFWGWGRNVVGLVKLTSAVTAYWATTKVLRDIRQRSVCVDELEEVESYREEDGSFEGSSLFHSLDNFENLYSAEVGDLNQGFIRRYGVNGKFKKKVFLRDGLRVERNPGVARKTLLQRHKIETTLKNEAEFFKPWVFDEFKDTLSREGISEDGNYGQAVELISKKIVDEYRGIVGQNNKLFVPKYHNSFYTCSQAMNSEKAERIPVKKEKLNKSIGRWTTVAIGSLATFGVATKLSGDRPT